MNRKRQTNRIQPAGSAQQKLENVGECLYRSTSSEIYYGITCVGKRQVKKSLHTDDYQLAKARLAEFRVKVGNSKPAAMAKMSFLQVGNFSLADHQHNLKSRTIRGKKDTIKKLDGVSGGKPMRSIGQGDVSRWKELKKRDGNSARAFNWELDIMPGVFHYAIKRGLILNDPTADTERMKPRFSPVVIPSKEEFKALVAGLQKSYKHAQVGDFVKFLACSATRQSEAAQVTFDCSPASPWASWLRWPTWIFLRMPDYGWPAGRKRPGRTRLDDEDQPSSSRLPSPVGPTRARLAAQELFQPLKQHRHLLAADLDFRQQKP